MVIYTHTTNISKPKVYMHCSTGLGSSSSLHGAIPPMICQNKIPAWFFCCKQHRCWQILTLTGQNGICGGHVYIIVKHLLRNGKTALNAQAACLHNINHLAEKRSIYPLTNSVYHSIRKYMDEPKGLFLHQDTWHYWNHHLPRSIVWSHTTYIPFIYVTKNCGWR